MKYSVLLFLPFIMLLSFASAASAQDGEYPSYQVTGFMQQHFSWEHDSDDPAAFSIHRARVGLTGSLTDMISVNIVAGAVEPPDRTPRLVNGFVDLDLHPMLTVRTGQFLVPFGLEGPEPIFRNPAIERTETIQRLNVHAMFRDIGIQAFGSHENVTYAIALVNGTGANNPEQIDPKDLLGRFGYQASSELNLGLSFHIGQYPVGNVERDRFRLGVDATYRADELLLRGEYIFRKDQRVGTSDRDHFGGYLLAGYDLTDELQAIARFEMLHPNSDADFSDAGFTSITAGLNYYFQGHNRVSVNYEIRNDRRSQHDPGNLLTVQMQVAL
ncbi:porin [Natronogracilivirga saccharolytica]|uniref:Outer membrane beta-barrel protein n=1 Tax=Natronogracilivirga saccharolytica TaxID=2812953 RepID=A0A8J7UTE9_9BACT|nr:porin [Natronogracilivirga saccharolytica]MBP3191270.1 outer membrane beta-barrel protein [Natronogracilivirga saccharolytica]